MERCLEKQQDVYICFIDYTKAFDRVRHKQMMECLKELDIDSRDIRLIEKLYWEQEAAVRIDDTLSKFQYIKRGVRQGCVLSPDLFSVYTEKIMRNIQNMPGIFINGHVINNLRYADDTALIASNENDLQILLNTVVAESKKMGLTMNEKKTVTIVASRKVNEPTCGIMMNDTKLKQVERFKYLG